MKFTLSTVGYWYLHESMIESYKKLGFTFSKHNNGRYQIDGNPTINISSIEELVKLSEDYGQLIIEGDSIRFYDDYNE